MNVVVIGAGVAGLACALELAERGASVEVLERSAALDASGCSWYAGGMLAPWCEIESSEPQVAILGEQGIAWWRERFPETVCNGSLVVAHSRDAGELTRFAHRTRHWQWIDQAHLSELEPDLADRFTRALFFAGEAHLDPRAALVALSQRLAILGVRIRWNVEAQAEALDSDAVVDCRGLAARDVLTDLRGVKGEMVLLRSRDVVIARPVRVLHPRTPVYVVPRGKGVFMVGATMIESDDPVGITARSVLELLNAACALHPALGEGQILELGTQVRPAFSDNLPRLRWRDHILYVNGLYRHGFLLAPALARMAAEAVLLGRFHPEVMDGDHRQRRCS